MWQSAVPSRFVDELPGEHVETEAAPGLSRGGLREGVSTMDRGLWTGAGGWSPRPALVRRRTPAMIEGRAREIETPHTAAFAIGDRVFHQKFGYGRVRAADGDKLEIEFEKAGTKKVIGSFVTAA